ncbi:MAG: NAD(P)/FAD-dependent oxidoreductase [Gammaproteobacteria bacterium]|nr:NAD(P)/FAD-dependent oxidoreductase [Gammaproteobacteria bacterium]
MKNVDVLIIGASASGLMCAIEAGKRNRTVTVLDHSNKAGKKILMSGGGRCNFTNYDVSADNYISHNPHFCKSALSRYTQWNFIELVQQYKIPHHEREHGQLFCDKSAKDILNMLLEECTLANVNIQLSTTISHIEKISDHHFRITTDRNEFHCQSVVIATGGLSIPTMGASPFGYKTAEQFNIKVWPVSAGLVPFTLHKKDKDRLALLSGIAVDSIVQTGQQTFRENILFTHRGLSGPAILQISSYWTPGENITINLLPDIDLYTLLKQAQKQSPQIKVKTLLSKYLPKRLIEIFMDNEIINSTLQTNSHDQFNKIADSFHQWTVQPNGTEGYRTAEVSLGGVDCDALSSKTMESREVKGLYFIGEVVDITGWLGGYNFQWAWSSAWCAGQYV